LKAIRLAHFRVQVWGNRARGENGLCSARRNRAGRPRSPSKVYSVRHHVCSVITVSEDTGLGEIARLFVTHRIKRAPVVETAA
jgi:CBS domain-containing protein